MRLHCSNVFPVLPKVDRIRVLSLACKLYDYLIQVVVDGVHSGVLSLGHVNLFLEFVDVHSIEKSLVFGVDFVDLVNKVILLGTSLIPDVLQYRLMLEMIQAGSLFWLELLGTLDSAPDLLIGLKLPNSHFHNKTAQINKSIKLDLLERLWILFPNVD